MDEFSIIKDYGYSNYDGKWFVIIEKDGKKEKINVWGSEINFKMELYRSLGYSVRYVREN